MAPADHSVVVVGAGLAGLRCALDLVAAGFEVIVLEARDRVGGRVFSHRFTDGQVAERGAEFVDAGHREVIALCAELGLELSRREATLDPLSTLVDAAGRAEPMGMHASIEPELARWSAALAEHVDHDESLAALLGSLGLSVMSRLVIGREIRTEFMLPPELVSRRFAREQAARQQVGREVHRVVGGNDQLATGLAASLGDRVRLRCPVSTIDPTGLVTTVAGEQLAARAVVAAVPLPVLSRIWDEVPGALSAVHYGVGGKISVQYRRRVWRDAGRNGTVLSDRAWGHLWETTDDQPGDAGVLTDLLASHDGAAFVALPEAPARLVDEVERIFPGSRGLAGERVHTDWTNDPFALGCYTTFGPDQIDDARGEAGRPHGRIWIAGEHADELAGFMEGALRSGRRTAAAIAIALAA